MNLRYVLLPVAVIILLFSLGTSSAWWPFSKDDDQHASAEDTREIRELTWADLIPDDFVQPENPFLSMTEQEIDKLMDGSEESNAEIARLQEVFNYAPVVPALDGLRVKLPAYVTPLEYNEQYMANEFLLVPYIGACIHVPPPPANQIVYVNSPEAIEIPQMYDAIWAVGTLRVETVQSMLAESGYLLEIEEVFPYE